MSETILRNPAILFERDEKDEQDPLNPGPPLPCIDSKSATEAGLSFAQIGSWLQERLSPGDSAFVVSASVRIQGELDPTALENALAELVARHDILRTGFRNREGEPAVCVVDSATVRIPLLDLSCIEGSRREADRAISQLTEWGFQVERPPLIRWTLIRLGWGDHVLLHAAHRTVVDEWSVEALFREFEEIFADRAAGRPAGRSQPRTQFAELVRQESRLLQGKELQDRLSFWRNRLEGAEGPWEIGARSPDPSADTGFASVQSTQILPEALCRSLASLSRSRGASLLSLLLAAFRCLLHRYTGRRDLLAGTTLPNRPSRRAQSLLGMMSNLVALRTSVKPEMGFIDVLDQTTDELERGKPFHDLPFHLLLKELNPKRPPRRFPLVPALLTLHPSEGFEMDPPGLSGRLIAGPRAATEGEIHVVAFERSLLPPIRSVKPEFSQAIGLRWVARSDRFRQDQVSRLARHFEMLLEGIAADPEQAIVDLPMLARSERQQLLHGWNRTADSREKRLVHDMVRDQALRRPDLPAVIMGDSCISFAELEQCAVVLAVELRKRCAQADAMIAIRMERSIELVVAVLAAFKSALPCLMLDPSMDGPSLQAALEQAATLRLLLTRSERAASAIGVPHLEIRHDQLLKEAGPDQARLPARFPVHPESIACITLDGSGAERAAMVALPHRALTNLAGWHQRTFNPLPAQRTALTAEPFESGFHWESWTSLAVGATVFIASDEDLSDPLRLRQWIEVQRIDHCFLPQTMADGLLQQTEGLQGLSLQTLLTRQGGSGMGLPGGGKPSTCEFHGYPETCGVALWTPAGPLQSPALLGRPIHNVQAVILDEWLNPAPLDAPGELYLAGAGLAGGYHDRPALTADRFIPDPHCAEDGQRLFRTGDRVWRRSDGQIELCAPADGRPGAASDRQSRPGLIEGPLGKTIEKIWRTAAPSSAADPMADFFDAGGDSLSAIRLLWLIERKTGVELSFTDLLEDPRLGAVAERIGSLLDLRAKQLERPRSPSPQLQEDSALRSPQVQASSSRSTAFSLCFSHGGWGDGSDRYKLLMEAARFADDHGFDALWTPECDSPSGDGAFPNPAISGTALAAATARIAVRAGDVALPMHSPFRVAQDWAMIDNISHGRIGISISAGSDASVTPSPSKRSRLRSERMVESLSLLQRLWRGDEIRVGGAGEPDLALKIAPRPVQAVLPVWIACDEAASFVQAGQLGVGVCLWALNKPLKQLEEAIRLYRQAWREAGHPGQGHVAVKVPALLGQDRDESLRQARRSWRRHQEAAWTDQAPEEATDRVERITASPQRGNVPALIGTVESCRPIVDLLGGIGVDEIACLVDFCVPPRTVLSGLRHLERLRREFEPLRPEKVG